jgi:hypothetical protein
MSKAAADILVGVLALCIFLITFMRNAIGYIRQLVVEQSHVIFM